MKKLYLFVFLVVTILLSLFCQLSTYAATISGTVVRVVDGDTFHFLPDQPVSGVKVHKNSTVTVRMRGIDAPERDQPYGVEAAEHLRNLILQQKIRLEIKDIDRYGRIVGYVWYNGKNINLEQVQAGYAWAYTEFLDRPYASEFYKAEQQARAERRGLWQQRNPVPPWEWRKIK